MTPSNAEPLDDYEELVALLNAHKVEYVIVGAYAVGYHGYIRATTDMDILVGCQPVNAVRLAAALLDFAGVAVDPGQIREKTLIELGREPNSVHIITTITGVAWKSAWSTRVKGEIGAQPAPFLSRECLIKNKRAIGRDKDYLDLKSLGAPPPVKRPPRPEK
ncbi:MAG TPA: hypothetical protein DCZ92_00840 [Elusimicrobia bacterium]|nr:MAG: hypothetical protein A2016_04540 [Elusimicrobia bacterium GWF2_62_30]HBA59372.1 hypothetical protein [Elusimicrobiota bacterium]